MAITGGPGRRTRSCDVNETFAGALTAFVGWDVVAALLCRSRNPNPTVAAAPMSCASMRPVNEIHAERDVIFLDHYTIRPQGRALGLCRGEDTVAHERAHGASAMPIKVSASAAQGRYGETSPKLA